MSKDTKTTEAIVDDILDTLEVSEPIVDDIPEVITPEVKEAKPEPAKADITALIKAMPETFTPATLDKLFKLNDGGKTVRRHLRKHFAAELAHEHKATWGFTTQSNQPIIQYFADRYSYDLTAIKA